MRAVPLRRRWVKAFRGSTASRSRARLSAESRCAAATCPWICCWRCRGSLCVLHGCVYFPLIAISWRTFYVPGTWVAPVHALYNPAPGGGRVATLVKH
ncbi:unnamed protein product [Boreogadus saida]